MGTPWKKLKYKILGKKNTYQVARAADKNGVSLTRIRKYDPLEERIAHVVPVSVNVFTNSTSLMVGTSLMVDEPDNRPRMPTPVTDPKNDLDIIKPVQEVSIKNHSHLKEVDLLGKGAMSDVNVVKVCPETGFSVSHDNMAQGGIMVTETQSTINGDIQHSHDDDFDEDPAYSTLDEISKNAGKPSNAIVVENEVVLRTAGDSNQKCDRSSRPSADSGMGSPGLKFDNANVLGETARTSVSPVSGRDSVSEFPTYDNWVLKQESKSTSERITENDTIFNENQTTVDDLYAIPDTTEKISHSSSIDSVDNAESAVEMVPPIGLGEYHSPPIPDRLYERTDSICNMGVNQPISVSNVDIIIKALVEESNNSVDTDDEPVIKSSTNNEEVASLADVKVTTHPSSSPSKTSGPHKAVIQVNAPAHLQSDTKCNNTLKENNEVVEVITEDQYAIDANNQVAIDTELSRNLEDMLAIEKNIEDESTKQPDDDNNAHVVISSGSTSPEDEPTHMSIEEVLESAHHQGLSMSPHDRTEVESESERNRRKCLDSLNYLKECGWYWGPLSAIEAEQKLENKPDGAFLVRDSSDDCYILSISFVSESITRHTRIEHHKGIFSFYSQPKSHECGNIRQFIENAMTHSRNHRFLYFTRPHGPGNPPIPVSLLYPVSRFKTMRTLQHMCRFTVLKFVRRDHIDNLPLPTNMKNYLKEAQYYVEFVEE